MIHTLSSLRPCHKIVILESQKYTMTSSADANLMPNENRDTVISEDYNGTDLNCLNSDTVSPDGNKQNIYFFEINRLKTFTRWPNTFRTTPQVLAKYGYIYIGPKDQVLCAFCYSKLQDMSSDTEVEKHCQDKRLCKDWCPFGEVNKPLSIEERQKQEKSVSTYINLGQRLSPKFPAMVNEDIRSDSFFNWPFDNEQKPPALAKAGFFSAVRTGKRDRVQCFMCGIAVHKWKLTDDAMEEHKRLRPECDFVIFNQIAVQAVHDCWKEYTIRQLIDAYKHLRSPDHEVTAEELVMSLPEEDYSGNS